MTSLSESKIDRACELALKGVDTYDIAEAINADLVEVKETLEEIGLEWDPDKEHWYDSETAPAPTAKPAPEWENEVLALARAGGARLTALQSKYGVFEVIGCLSRNGFGWEDDIVVPREMPKPKKGKPEFKRVQKGGSIVLEDFRAHEPADEKWFACKHPFSSYAVSSYARVARLVGKPGVSARKVLRPRTRFNFKTRQSELVVQLRNDAGKKLDYSVKWLFENHRPKTAAEIARRKASADRKAERDRA